MSNHSSDKCSKEELADFKKEVILWLKEKGYYSDKKMKIRAYPCYNGDFRIYTGYMEIPNIKSSFRRTEAEKDDKGNITGWNGTRGHHTQRLAEYITINRDEFEKIKNLKEGDDDYDFYEDYLFNKLKAGEKSL